mgnify:CR=1 FL=1
MPELPEVEVVRRGVDKWATGRKIVGVDVLLARTVRRSPGGANALSHALVDDEFRCASRRGKYLWLPLREKSRLAVVIHLGMSGQILMQPGTSQHERHLRALVRFSDAGRDLRFVDQRTFGGIQLDELIDDGAGGRLPASVAHIGRDPLDPEFDPRGAARLIRSKQSEIKRILLDQTVISGIGNIYADEALWGMGIHGRRPASRLSVTNLMGLIDHASEVMRKALGEGGTSFDSLYVNVNGESGYFERSLKAYGREGEPCYRCGSSIRREAFMNRSSYFCPRCQRASPTARHGRSPGAGHASAAAR